jgi:AcrR family transcriptional regulator
MSSTQTSQSLPRSRTPATEARAQLLDTAERLFYREGARNVGIDAVVKQAGVNKMTLYRQFSSKDALLLAYLERRDKIFWEYYEASIAKHPGNARAGLEQLFVDLAGRTQSANYRGCPFVNIACEFPERDHPTRQFVAQNKQRLLDWLTGHARAAGARQPEALGIGLALLIEGAYTASQTYAEGNPLLPALPNIAHNMIAAAL